MRAAAERLLAPQFREIVRMIDEPILQPIYDLETPRMAFGRVAIIGDAAFVARPHVAAGVAKAADDAAALVAALAVDDVAPALQRFEAARLPVGSASSSVRAISGLICRQRRPPRSAPAPSATAFPKRCWRRRRCSISCASRAGERRPALNAAIPRLSGALAGIANPANLPVCARARMALARADEVIE